ncbi:hypothetical protein JOF53_006061 [Crossiella equi]|uniref:DUF4097 domain-containing protein n=1 Tax=Crossiella equi TaxID=130796 RepID=A0ABS5ALT6_9PSEU|nr:DUF4097 family beta strand repeat-containing protein [Crossiella equi]MBP2477189.1 hypothetical protein [Crossiella equi]
MSETGQQPAATRDEEFASEGPVELKIEIGAGRIEVRLSDAPGVHVRLTHEPGAASGLGQSLTGLFSWVSDQFGGGLARGAAGPGPAGEQAGGPAEAGAEVLRRTTVEYSGGQLRVRTPSDLPLRLVPVKVEVRAPSLSHVTAQSGSGDITVTGSANRLDVHTGTGQIAVDRADGAASVNAGSGSVRLGPMLGGLRARSGSGDLEVSSVGGVSELTTSRGSVWLGAVQADVRVRTGTGDLTVADAAEGRLDLRTGSGELRVGIRQGVAAELDLESSYGQARSDLEVRGDERPHDLRLRVTGRTGYGNVVVSSTTV